MITGILVVLIIIIILLIWLKSKEVSKEVEKLIDLNNIPNDRPPLMAPQIDPNFIEAMFHSDYMDVITSFNNLSPNQRQIFNINNVPCKVTKDSDITKVGEIIGDFIESLNDDIQECSFNSQC